METELKISCQRNKYKKNYYAIEIESRTYLSDVEFAKIQEAIDTIKKILDPLIEKELEVKNGKDESGEKSDSQ